MGSMVYIKEENKIVGKKVKLTKYSSLLDAAYLFFHLPCLVTLFSNAALRRLVNPGITIEAPR